MIQLDKIGEQLRTLQKKIPSEVLQMQVVQAL